MPLFKHKRRSAHGAPFSTQSSPSSGPTDGTGRVRASSMGSVGEQVHGLLAAQAPAHGVDSVIAGHSTNASAKNHGDYGGPISESEPLVMDFAELHDGLNGSNPPAALSLAKTTACSLLDEDTAAAPPDISVRRDISQHVPLRTR
jgi:hypothetical protein